MQDHYEEENFYDEEDSEVEELYKDDCRERTRDMIAEEAFKKNFPGF